MIDQSNTISISSKPNFLASAEAWYIANPSPLILVKDNDCKVSMDGRGAWLDNVMVERLWRSVKYEWVCLRAYKSAAVAQNDIADYFKWYNSEREHSSLNEQTPDELYFKTVKELITLNKTVQ